MIKIILLSILPLFCFSQREEPCITLQQIIDCGNEVTGGIVLSNVECRGDINVTNYPSAGGVDIYNSGNIVCRDGNNNACINIFANDGTISMKNTNAINAEVEMKFVGTTTQIAIFKHNTGQDTLAYTNDIIKNLSLMTATLPIYLNDSIAGANGLTTGKMYLTIINGDAILKVKQ